MLSSLFLFGSNIYAEFILIILLSFSTVYLGIKQVEVSKNFNERNKSIILGFIFGIMIFSIIDVFKGSSNLGVEFGIKFPIFQLSLLISFIIGLLLPSLFEINNFLESDQNYVRFSYLFALGIGFHSFSEGVVIGLDLLADYDFTLLQRFAQTMSFLLHKFSEGLIISVPLLFVTSKTSKVIFNLTLISILPLIFGSMFGFLGYGSLASYFFSAGAGSLIYILYRFGRIFNNISERRIIYLGIIIGILYMYSSGIIHSIEF